MRGRKTRPLTVPSADAAVLRLIAGRTDLPAYQIQRARIVLGVALGQPTAAVAAEAGCNTSTVWRVCRLYERGGLSGLLADGRRQSAARSFFRLPPPGEAG